MRAIDASHLFEPNTIYVTLHRGSWLRRYALDFIEWFAPQLTHDVVLRALRSGSGARAQAGTAAAL